MIEREDCTYTKQTLIYKQAHSTQPKTTHIEQPTKNRQRGEIDGEMSSGQGRWVSTTGVDWGNKASQPQHTQTHIDIYKYDRESRKGKEEGGGRVQKRGKPMTNQEGRKKPGTRGEGELYHFLSAGVSFILEMFIPFDPRRPTNSHTEGHWRGPDLLQ